MVKGLKLNIKIISISPIAKFNGTRATSTLVSSAIIEREARACAIRQVSVSQNNKPPGQYDWWFFLI